MYSIKINQYLNNVLIFILIAIFMLTLQSCAKKIAFTNSSVVPAAEGTVKIKKDNNNNNVIKLDITYLAKPDRLTPPKKVYVVWVTNQDGITQNVGRIISNNGLKASFETTTPFKPVKVFITAEDNGLLQYPGYTKVLETDNF